MIKKLDWHWIAGIILILTISRLIPHPPNFTPIGAMAILAGLLIKDLRLAIAIPLAAMLLSDLIIGLHNSLLYVYAAIVIIVLCNRYLLKNIRLSSLGVSSLLSAIIFFLVTNFGAWLSHDLYPRTANGLLQAYVAGIPFFYNTLLSTLFFIGISAATLTFASKRLAIE